MHVPLSPVNVFFLVHSQSHHCPSNGNSHRNEQLQQRAHSRFLSTMMPMTKKDIPETSTSVKTLQGTLFGSKSWYRGAKTKIRTPISRSASPYISAECFFSDKITSVFRPKRYTTDYSVCSSEAVLSRSGPFAAQHTNCSLVSLRPFRFPRIVTATLSVWKKVLASS